MKGLAALILFLYAVGILIVLFLLIYLIIKRVEEKDNENFGKRKN